MTMAYGSFMIKEGLSFSVKAAIGHSPKAAAKVRLFSIQQKLFLGFYFHGIRLRSQHIAFKQKRLLDAVVPNGIRGSNSV